MKDVTKYWRARDILGNCSDYLHIYMDRRASLVVVARELGHASDDKTLDGALPEKLALLQKKLGVGPLAERPGEVEVAVASLTDEDVLKVYAEIRELELALHGV